MLYQHSFWYRASQKTFEDVLKADPECGIAYWGIALSLLWNPHVPPPAKNLAEGAAAIAKGKSVGAKTQRERDYIDALAVMYADHEKVGHRPRIEAYAKAMEALAQKYPKDDEADDPLRAGAQHVSFAGRQELRQPAQGRGDPGADLQAPAAASRRRALPDPPLRLPADRREGPQRRAALRQDRARRRRTPSTCRRTSSPASAIGRSSIASNAEVGAGREAIGRIRRTTSSMRMDYRSMPISSSGRTRRPRPCIDEHGDGRRLHRDIPGRHPMRCAISPARYAIERGDWKAAAELQVRPSPLAHVQAITHFARALGAARSGNPAAAKADIAKLAELRDKLRAAKDAYWSEQVDIQIEGRVGLGALCRGQARRRAQGDERRRRCRRQDREASGDAGRAQAGARALRRHAARSRHGQGGAGRVRGHAEEGAQPARRLCRRGASRGEGRRCRQGAGVLQEDRLDGRAAPTRPGPRSRTPAPPSTARSADASCATVP